MRSLLSRGVKTSPDPSRIRRSRDSGDRSHKGESGQLGYAWDRHQPTAGHRTPRHAPHVCVDRSDRRHHGSPRRNQTPMGQRDRRNNRDPGSSRVYSPVESLCPGHSRTCLVYAQVGSDNLRVTSLEARGPLPKRRMLLTVRGAGTARPARAHSLGYAGTAENRPHCVSVADPPLCRSVGSVSLRGAQRSRGRRRTLRRSALRHRGRLLEPSPAKNALST
jgi:hypothetical protein